MASKRFRIRNIYKCRPLIYMIYLNFAKAFVSVDHAILHHKLYVHGLRGSILLWFKDYLTDRCQRVVLENVASEWYPVTSGEHFRAIVTHNFYQY